MLLGSLKLVLLIAHHQNPNPMIPEGAYLAQLYEYERLPDFVDPTAPAEPILIDNETGMLSAPAHPEVFFNLQSSD
ncbi:hypothetical protein M422DRAFT_272412 [Sphaerobolus stellatus SS14]|uniref:Uncharacterized protein n=1 Tax=Sphaerobolus stellatus (strain SS14) TaxID=990650 RepID=A0A0C9UM33_SPHS4|nr:hypothetical protein M422DRAFT_272412 [Sphaerobolus stellatus SS14]